MIRIRNTGFLQTLVKRFVNVLRKHILMRHTSINIHVPCFIFRRIHRSDFGKFDSGQLIKGFRRSVFGGTDILSTVMNLTNINESTPYEQQK